MMRPSSLPPSRRRGDGQELMTRVCLWNKAGDDIGDMVSRSRRVVDTMQELLGGQGRSNSGCMRVCVIAISVFLPPSKFYAEYLVVVLNWSHPPQEIYHYHSKLMMKSAEAKFFISFI